MPICIECRYPVQQLYTVYSKADDRALGKGVRLTQCPRCKRFADKYVEHDFVVLFIDLVLIKPQVYRHLLFNRLGREDDRLDPTIIRLGILLLLFDVYLTWARVEKQEPPEDSSSIAPSLLAQKPIVVQYLYFLFLCLTESLTFHLTIRLLARFLLHYPRPNSVSTALLVSSCTKLFPVLMVIWEYDIPAAAKAVGWAVVLNNVEALNILLGCGYLKTGFLAGLGALTRLAASTAVMKVMGLEVGTTGAHIGDLRTLWSWARKWVDAILLHKSL